MKRYILFILLYLMGTMAYAEKLYTVILPVPVSVYENAVTDAKVIGSLAPSQQVEVYVVNGDWAIIKYNNGVGYVAAACLKEVTTSATTTPQNAAPKNEPAKVQPAKEKSTPATSTTPAQTKQSTPAPKVVQHEETAAPKSQKNNPYSPYKTYTLRSKENRVSDFLRCKGQMYIALNYQRTTAFDPTAETGLRIKAPFRIGSEATTTLNGGGFDFGGIVRIWGPIGLDMNFGLAYGAGKYDEPSWNKNGVQYESTRRSKLDYNVAIRPVFYVSLPKEWSVYAFSGPRFDFCFMDMERSKGNMDNDFESDFHFAGDKNAIFRALSIPWGVGLGIQHKHIGVRVNYEWDMFRDFKKDYKKNIFGNDSVKYFDYEYNEPFKYLTVSLVFPFEL
ncbi:MAG: hypothetical protein PUG15_02480 [Bacteroidales bacterium]|nr:hypothetical protein [Bacteroidales bacterium]